MANERRLIDADVAIERLKLEGVMRYPQSWGMGLLAAMETIRSSPIVDAVEVVRCSQCKHGEADDPDFPDQFYCHSGFGWNEDNFFCSYGERKSGTQPQREDV